MTIAPLLQADLPIRLHAFAAIGAFVLGLVQFAAPKGTIPHRAVGWAWVVLMATVCVTAFSIHHLRMWGPFSPIHLLTILVCVMLPIAIVHARRHRVEHHRQTMMWLYLGALVIAGGFTFWPGRIMYEVLVGH